MTWRSFMDYVLMRELGQADAIVRNYDLRNLNGSKPGIIIDRAFARMGFDQPRTARPLIVPTIAAYLINMGYQRCLTRDELEWRIREWYNWDRIRKGEIRQWPLKTVQDNPLLG